VRVVVSQHHQEVLGQLSDSTVQPNGCRVSINGGGNGVAWGLNGSEPSCRDGSDGHAQLIGSINRGRGRGRNLIARGEGRGVTRSNVSWEQESI